MKAITRLMISAGCLASVLLIGSGSSGGSLISTAQAQEQERAQPRCSERTVKGTYAFGIQGNVEGVGPIAASGTTAFDGKGKTTISGFINTRTGDPAIEATFFGTYTVNPEDCTGSAIFDIPAPGLFGKFTELRFEAVIVNNGAEIRYLIITPGVVFAGSSTRQFPGTHQ
jgi:hypothetical protein